MILSGDRGDGDRDRVERKLLELPKRRCSDKQFLEKKGRHVWMGKINREQHAAAVVTNADTTETTQRRRDKSHRDRNAERRFAPGLNSAPAISYGVA